jgi:hypothetical protein
VRKVLLKSSDGHPLHVCLGEDGEWLHQSVHLRALFTVEVLPELVLVPHREVAVAAIEGCLMSAILPLAPRQRLHPTPHHIAFDDARLQLRLREIGCDVVAAVPLEDTLPHVL